MKFILITALSLVSSAAMADGFRCQGEGFRAKLYNEVQPERGTRNPAVLIVSQRNAGTIATLEGDEIEKTVTDHAVAYEGKTNGKVDGRFVYVKLEVAKRARQTGPLAGLHSARLTVNQDGASALASMVCDRYLKQPRE